MANREKGEVSLAAGGETYTLRLSINALCELEDVFDQPIGEIVTLLQADGGVRISHLREIVRAALSEHHPGLTAPEVGRIMSDAGIDRIGGVLGELFSATFPDRKGDAGAKPGANPRTAKG